MKVTNIELNGWAEVLTRNYDALMDAAVKAGKEAIRNKHLRYIVQIDVNGDIRTWYDIAGGNAMSEDAFNGNAVEVFDICYQCLDECIYYDSEAEKEGGLNLEDSKDEFIEAGEYWSYQAILDGQIENYKNEEC